MLQTASPETARDGGAPAPAAGSPLSRRQLFGGAAVAAAFWGAAAQTRRAAAAPPPVSADVDPGAMIPKLVRRTTMGITEADLALANSLGYDGWLEYQLDHLNIPENPALEARIATLTTLTMTPQQLYPLPEGLVVSELIEATILRAVMSRRQLYERMVEFWSDHFNIHHDAAVHVKTVDDRDVARAHALGAFPAILDASAHSPAMLLYLDNVNSNNLHPNENYARELMELHTMGADGGYTQQDVVEVARCFTGWSCYGVNLSNPLTGTFRFIPAIHDDGQKIVLGNIIPPGGGIQDGLTVLDILVNHPSTARFIAKKLSRRLLGENVPQGVIDSVAAAYTSTGGDIKAMIRAALRPNHLYDAEPRYKRPFHLLVSALRTTGATIATTAGLRAQLSAAGHRPFNWSPPDGYPDTLAYWHGLILPRWSFGAALVSGAVSGTSIDPAAFFAGAADAQAMADRINARMFAGELTAAELACIRDYLLPDPPTTARQRDAIGLAIGAPSFQWY